MPPWTCASAGPTMPGMRPGFDLGQTHAITLLIVLVGWAVAARASEFGGGMVWGLLASFYIGNLMLVLINVPLAPLFASILRVKYAYMYPAIIVLCFIGAFSVDNHMTGVYLAFIFGIVGWFAVKYDYPLAPMILGIILGGPFERSIVQSSEIGRGSLTVYFQHPIAMALLAVVVAMVVLPTLISRLRRRAGKRPITDLALPPESLATEASSPAPPANSIDDLEKGDNVPLASRGQIGKN